MNKPIVSIVIPTKNRPKTLEKLIESILEWPIQNFEIVVNDNSDDNILTQKLINKYMLDSRLKYFYHEGYLSMSSNCGMAIEKATGEYICFLGDDDGVTSCVVKLCEWMETNNIDTANFSKASYTWPDLAKKIDNRETLEGELILPECEYVYKSIDSTEELRTFLSKGLFCKFSGPVPYHGVARKNIFEMVVSKTNECFPAPTPDFSGLISASIYSNRHIYIPLPIVCSGQSLNSAGGLGRRGRHIGELSAVSSFSKKDVDDWSSLLPKYWSSITVNSESTIKTLEALNEIELLELLNIERLYASMVNHVPSYSIRTIRKFLDLKQTHTKKLSGIKFIYYLFEVMFFRLKSRLSNSRGRYKFNKFYAPDIKAALSIVEDKISTNFYQAIHES